jgi:quercetin dioxygenase-like cupin family protein
MSQDEITLVELNTAKQSTPEPGLARRVLASSEKLMLVRHLMEKGWVGTKHSHPHEQLVYIVRGHIEFTGADRTFDARTGDSFIVPGGVEHHARALEDSEVLDVFTPFREDYAPQK